MWSFKKKIFFANKKAYVKIDSGLWSDRFSLDVAGNSGSIMCKTNDILYQVKFILLFNYYLCIYIYIFV